MIHSGTKPSELDPRDYSYHQTFGTTTQFPLEYTVDAGLTMPDQNADGNPFSCTAYTTCDLGADQDNILYAPSYTYMKTLFSQGLPPTQQGSDIRPSLKTARVYGLLPAKNVPDSLVAKPVNVTAKQENWPTELDAESGKLEHRKAAYYNIYCDGGLDWFDSFRSAMIQNSADKRGISVGTPWFREFATPINGVLPNNFAYDGNPYSVGWHNYSIKGWKQINGVPYLLVKSWQGSTYGDNGWAYMSRELCNKIMEVRGSVAFTLADATDKDTLSIKIGMYEQVLFYLYKILRLKLYA